MERKERTATEYDEEQCAAKVCEEPLCKIGVYTLVCSCVGVEYVIVLSHCSLLLWQK